MAQQVLNLDVADSQLGTTLRAGGVMINANFTELYSYTSQTINAGAPAYGFPTGTAREAAITAAIADAYSLGRPRVFVPDSMTPYNAALVTFNNAIQMTTEGGAVGEYDVRAYGAYVDGITDDAAAIQACINAVHAIPKGGKVRLGTGQSICFSPLTSYANVNVAGSGTEQSILAFNNVTNGIELVCPSFNTLCGVYEDFQINGIGVFPGTLTGPQQTAALSTIGFKAYYCATLVLRRLTITGFGIPLNIRDWDHVTLEGILVGGNRSGIGSVVIGDASTTLGGYGGSTANGIFARDVWISGGAGSNGYVDTGAGLVIDRATMVQWVGGTIESAGVGAKIGATNNGTDGFRCTNITLVGVDFENCKGKYVEVGTAETSASPAVSGLHLIDINGSLAGSANTTVGAAIRNVRDFTAHGHAFPLAGAGVAYWDFVGTNNHPSVDIGPAYNYSLSGAVYLRSNGVTLAGSVEEHVIGLPSFGTAADARAVSRVPYLVGELATLDAMASIRGSVATTSTIAAAVFSPGATTGMFEIYAWTDVANYHAVMRYTSTNIFNGVLDNVSGSGSFALSNAGGQINVTQSSGSARTVNYVIRRLA